MDPRDAEIRKATKDLVDEKAREYLAHAGGSYSAALVDAARENLELKSNVMQMRRLLEATNGVLERLMSDDGFARAAFGASPEPPSGD